MIVAIEPINGLIEILANDQSHILGKTSTQQIIVKNSMLLKYMTPRKLSYNLLVFTVC